MGVPVWMGKIPKGLTTTQRTMGNWGKMRAREVVLPSREHTIVWPVPDAQPWKHTRTHTHMHVCTCACMYIDKLFLYKIWLQTKLTYSEYTRETFWKDKKKTTLWLILGLKTLLTVWCAHLWYNEILYLFTNHHRAFLNFIHTTGKFCSRV